MPEVYQQAIADGDPDWGVGHEQWAGTWSIAQDALRFSRGKGFVIIDHKEGKQGPERPLRSVGDALEAQLSRARNDQVFEVRALKDNYARLFRRHRTRDTTAERIEQEGRSLIGTPYVFGGTDCSWLTKHCMEIAGVILPHNAHAQHEMFRHSSGLYLIAREKIKPMDLLWHHDDEHVSLYLDNGRVIDTEPHSTTAPAGWPTDTTGTGVRIRPMDNGWYCDWANVCGIGRVGSVNGRP